ncbi:MAG: aldehyde dehydrogenase (NADP(+)) [Bacteroidota bacterium]
MHGQNSIGFQRSAEGTLSFKSSNPSSGEKFQTAFIQATPDEVNRSVELAANAFITYNFFAPQRRAHFLNEIAVQLRARADELKSMFCVESALTAERAEQELQRTIFQLESFAKALNEGEFFATIDNSNEDNFLAIVPKLQRRMQGVGPVVVFGASNFPLAYSTAGGDTVSALAAGCPVIVKAHPFHAGTSSMVAEAILVAAQITQMPEGVFSHLLAEDFSVGQQLVSHPGIKAVGFTGSLEGGRALMDLAAVRREPIPVFAEMGSVNPMILQADFIAKYEDQLDSIATSICNAAGQFCTQPGLIFVEECPKTKGFITSLGNRVADFGTSTMLHSSIAEKYNALRQKAVSSEIEQVFEGEIKGENQGKNTLLVVTMEQFCSQETLQQEVFGPFSIVIHYANQQELFKGLQKIAGALTASVFTEEQMDFQHPLIQLLSSKVGRIILNGLPTGVTVSSAMTHGGPFPASSDGRYTAVGMGSIYRWLRPVTLQNFSQ